jgi:hypothetical protein
VHWLAKSTRAPVEAIPAQMNILANIAAKEKDEETKKAMGDYILVAIAWGSAQLYSWWKRRR